MAVLVGVSVSRRYERDVAIRSWWTVCCSPRLVVGFVGARLAYIATNTGRFQGR
jgi:hypothetical protein